MENKIPMQLLQASIQQAPKAVRIHSAIYICVYDAILKVFQGCCALFVISHPHINFNISKHHLNRIKNQ